MLWRVPATAKGRIVRGLVTLTVQGTSTTRGFSRPRQLADEAAAERAAQALLGEPEDSDRSSGAADLDRAGEEEREVGVGQRDRPAQLDARRDRVAHEREAARAREPAGRSRRRAAASRWRRSRSPRPLGASSRRSRRWQAGRCAPAAWRRAAGRATGTSGLPRGQAVGRDRAVGEPRANGVRRAARRIGGRHAVADAGDDEQVALREPRYDGRRRCRSACACRSRR